MNLRFVFCLLALVCLNFLPGFSQPNALSAAEAAQPARLHPLTLPHLTWLPGSDDLVFAEGTGADRQLMRFSVGKGRKTALLSLSELNNALNKAGSAAVTDFPEMRWLSPRVLVMPVAGQLYSVDAEARLATRLSPLPAAATGAQVHPGLLHTAFTTTDGELWIAATGKEPVEVAAQIPPPRPGSVGKSPRRFLNEPKGWSPSGHAFCFWTAPAGGAMNMHLYEVQAQKTISIPTDAAWPYVVSLTWAPDGQTLLAGQLSREQHRLRLNQFDARTGKLLRTVLEERGSGREFGSQGPVFLPNRPDQFLWRSARDGFDHLYLYNTEGHQIRQVTAGNWVVTDMLGFGAKGNLAYYTSTAESPIERHFYSVHLSSGQTTRISQGTGVHTPVLSPTGSYFLNSFSSFVVANQIRVLEAGGKIRHTLLTDRNPLEEYRTGDVDLVPIKTPDGTDVYSRLITPPGFDRSRRYPVVVYLNQNPGEQRVLNTWLGGGELWMHWLAQSGYLVFELDGRGTAHRGRAFAEATSGEPGQVERADQQAGIQYVRSLPLVDGNRIGIMGVGAGGYLALELISDAATSVKAGIALRPAVSWPSYGVPFPPSPAAPAKNEQRSLPEQVRLLLMPGSPGSGTTSIPSDSGQVEILSPKTPAANVNDLWTEELLLQIHRFLEKNL